MPEVTIAVNRVEGPNEHGFYDVYDQSGKKYGTQDDNLAQLAETLTGQVCVFNYDESTKQYTGRDGKPRSFVNLYLRGLTPSQSAIPTPQAVRSDGGGPQGHPDDTALRCLELAAKTLGAMEQGDAEGIVERAKRFVYFVETGQ